MYPIPSYIGYGTHTSGFLFAPLRSRVNGALRFRASLIERACCPTSARTESDAYVRTYAGTPSMHALWVVAALLLCSVAPREAHEHINRTPWLRERAPRERSRCTPKSHCATKARFLADVRAGGVVCVWQHLSSAIAREPLHKYTLLVDDTTLRGSGDGATRTRRRDIRTPIVTAKAFSQHINCITPHLFPRRS